MSDPRESILEEGQMILWQGRPNSMFAMTRDDITPAIFGLVFNRFSLIRMAIASLGGSWFWMFGLIHFTAGLCTTAYAVARDTVARRYSYYTLTSRRAIIGLSYPWATQSLRKFRITPKTKIKTDYQHTVVFGPADRSKRHSLPTRAPQFTRIDDAEKLYHLMLQIQKETP